MERKIEVKIMGQEYKLITDRPEEEAREIASRVDGLLRNIKEKDPYISDTRAAVLLSLNLAEGIFRLEKKIKKLRELLP